MPPQKLGLQMIGHQDSRTQASVGEEGADLAFPAEPPTAERRQPTDIVLDCLLVTEDRHRGAFASSGGREKALLVLKQVPVLDDGSLEGITDFQASTVAKDDPPIIFEASGKSLPSSASSMGTAQSPITPTHACFPSNVTSVCHPSPQWTRSRSPRRRPCSMPTAAGGQ